MTGKYTARVRQLIEERIAMLRNEADSLEAELDADTIVPEVETAIQGHLIDRRLRGRGKHWASTPEGRAHMSKMQKARWAKVKRGRK